MYLIIKMYKYYFKIHNFIWGGDCSLRWQNHSHFLLLLPKYYRIFFCLFLQFYFHWLKHTSTNHCLFVFLFVIQNKLQSPFQLYNNYMVTVDLSWLCFFFFNTLSFFYFKCKYYFFMYLYNFYSYSSDF